MTQKSTVTRQTEILPMTEERFPKRLRVLRSIDFQRVMAARVSATDGVLRMFAAPNEFGYPRLGLTASRRAGGAVLRNRWKRMIREAFRLTQQELPALDIVCVMRNMPTPALQSMMVSLRRLAERIENQLERRERPGRSGTPERDGAGT